MIDILSALFILIMMEGILSVDNALALAVIVKHLPEEQQKKALVYGIWGAYAFRAIALLLGVFLIKLWFIKLAGALYLLHMAYVHFFGKEDEGETSNDSSKGFWRTIIAVELADIGFSIDSIVATLGVSDSFWVLFTGGCLGILMMRYCASIFIKLLKKYPEFENTAFVLIALIGAKLLLTVFNIHIPELMFYGLMGATFFGTFALHKIKVTGEQTNEM